MNCTIQYLNNTIIFVKSALHLHNDSRKLSTLIENKTSYNTDSSQLNVFETYKQCSRIGLTFNTPVIVSMITGKKVMHLENKPKFDFFPGESVVLPPKKGMLIDFPDATFSSPTQCIALELEPKSIMETVGLFNQKTELEYDENRWDFETAGSHLRNDEMLTQLMSRIIRTFTGPDSSKDLILDLMVKELIVRLLQSRARHAILEGKDNLENTNRIAYVAKFIQQNLATDLSVDTLADKAYMSESHFFRTFKQTLGLTPSEFINNERVAWAQSLIKTTSKPLSEISEIVGYNSVSYFNRIFKRITGYTPSQFKANFTFN